MRRSVMVVVLGLAALAVLPGLLSAEKPESQMYLVVDCAVKPSTEARFWDAAKDEVAYYARNGYPYAWRTYAGEDGHYYFIYPVKDLADVGAAYAASAEVITKDAAGHEALSAKYAGTYESYRMMILTFSPELSIIPANPYYRPAPMDFIWLDIWSIDPEKEEEAEKNWKELVALANKKGVRDTWNCLIGGLGTDAPVYVFAGPEKNEIESLEHNEEMWKLLGDDADAPYDKGLSVCRKRESRHLWYQAELSYAPVKK
jgi:hypothetical protein